MHSKQLKFDFFDKLFLDLLKYEYVLIKAPVEFPILPIGSDLDLFTINLNILERIILSHLNALCNDNSLFKIRIINLNSSHTQIDVICEDILIVKFDLFTLNPDYKNIILKNSYFVALLNASVVINLNMIQVKVPSEIDELILRYIEYIEYYATRPDKIKHANYVYKKLSDNDAEFNRLFFNRLHSYTEIPHFVEQSTKTEKFSRLKFNINRLKEATKRHGFHGIIKIILHRYIVKSVARS